MMASEPTSPRSLCPEIRAGINKDHHGGFRRKRQCFRVGSRPRGQHSMARRCSHVLLALEQPVGMRPFKSPRWEKRKALRGVGLLPVNRPPDLWLSDVPYSHPQRGGRAMGTQRTAVHQSHGQGALHLHFIFFICVTFDSLLMKSFPWKSMVITM